MSLRSDSGVQPPCWVLPPGSWGEEGTLGVGPAAITVPPAAVRPQGPVSSQVTVILYLSVVGALLLYMAFLMLVDPLIRKPDAYTEQLHNAEEDEVAATAAEQGPASPTPPVHRPTQRQHGPHMPAFSLGGDCPVRPRMTQGWPWVSPGCPAPAALVAAGRPCPPAALRRAGAGASWARCERRPGFSVVSGWRGASGSGITSRDPRHCSGRSMAPRAREKSGLSGTNRASGGQWARGAGHFRAEWARWKCGRSRLPKAHVSR